MMTPDELATMIRELQTQAQELRHKAAQLETAANLMRHLIEQMQAQEPE